MGYKHFIGVDVSKNEVDFAILKDNQFIYHQEVKNNCDDIDAFLGMIKEVHSLTLSKCLFCMEHTGHYNNHLLTCLNRRKAKVVVENALQISNSLGITRGKSDRLDALRIGEYAYRFQDRLKLWAPKRPVIQLLATLLSLRLRMVQMQMAVKNPLKEQEQFIKTGMHKKTINLCSRTTKAIKSDLEKIDYTIQNTIGSDTILKRLMDVVTSVPNIGIITGAYIIATTNEFLDISETKKFACYAGIAPFAYESGTVQSKRRVSPIANRKMKALLHICAMASVSRPGELRDYYHRKTKGEGKPKMLVLNAIRFKLISRVFTCVRQDRLYIKEDYNHSTVYLNSQLANS